jgi:hypothetical protein
MLTALQLDLSANVMGIAESGEAVEKAKCMGSRIVKRVIGRL